MNDEEKKAVEFIRDLIAWDVRQDLCPNKEECKNLEIILNLIEKQQKEIDELQSYIKEYLIPKSTINLLYVSKDKIREKIKEYKGLKEIDKMAYEEQIKPLQELLKEE